MKLYLLVESKTIAEYKNKKEAEADRDNNEIWHPENNYKIVEQDIKED